MVENELFELYIGNTYSRDFIVFNFPLTINQVYFTVKESDKDKKYKLQKKLNHGITIVDEEEGKITYNLLINPEDTDDLKVGKNYNCDVTVVSNSIPKVKKTIITGILRLKDHTTRVYNE